MMAITTNSSISVNARRDLGRLPRENMADLRTENGREEPAPKPIYPATCPWTSVRRKSRPA